MSKSYEDDSSYYSKNKLNIAFIAEDSKQVRDMQSRSLSGSVSERQSISSISRIHSHGNSVPGSPFLSFQPQISSMEEWSKQTPNIFGKKQPIFADFRKRQTRNSIPEPILEMLEDDRQVQKMSKCTKKRIMSGQKINKVITIIQPTTFNQYELRSKVKFSILNAVQINNENPNNNENSNQNDSSSDQLRQMVEEIRDNQNNGSNNQQSNSQTQTNNNSAKKNFPLTRNAKKMLAQ